MTKKAALVATGVLATIFIVWKIGVHSRPQQPNIVLIIVDALRADKLGCYGFSREISPEIDALANDGVLFENAFSHCSWTRPSIGSMITSLYPRSLGIYREKNELLADRYLTLAEILKSRGYRTFGITANPNTNTVFNFDQGFDEYRDSRIVWNWMKPGKGQDKIDRDSNLRRSRDTFDEILKTVESYKPKARPVYVQALVMEVHSPWLIRPEYELTYENYPVHPNRYDKDPNELALLMRGTLGAVRQISGDIGEFVRRFRSLPGRKNTLFIITSDHGQGLDDHPEVFNSTLHGNLLYQSQLKVPLIFFHSCEKGSNSCRKYRPHKVKERVTLLGLLPTILDYVGVPPLQNQKESPPIQGTSFLPFITEKNSPSGSDEFFVAETHWRNVDKIALYGDQWVYIHNLDRWEGVNEFELQPIGIKENGRITDCILQERAVAEEMKKQLDEWLASHRWTKPTLRRKPLDKKEIQQLKSLGYLK